MITKDSTQPLYMALAAQFRQQIQEGVLTPGERLPAHAELRARGISQNTIDKAYDVLEQEGLAVRRHRKGIFVAVPARRVQQGIIGVIGHGFYTTGQSTYWSHLFEGVREVAERAGVQILFLNYTTRDWEKADGILMCDWSGTQMQRLVALGMPRVSLLTDVENAAAVAADDYGGSYQATEHLLALGHRRIAYLVSTTSPAIQRRLSGYRDALTAAGVEADSRWVRQVGPPLDYGERYIQFGRAAIQDWLREDWSELGCTALLAHNDEVAVGAMTALREAGLRVPQDISIVGFDGSDLGKYVTPSLTTVEVPLRAIGTAATELLLRQIETGEISGEHRVMPVQLKVRESTAALLQPYTSHTASISREG